MRSVPALSTLCLSALDLKCFEKSLLFFALHLPRTPIYLTVIRSCIMIHNFSLYSCLYLMAKRLLLFVVSDKICFIFLFFFPTLNVLLNLV